MSSSASDSLWSSPEEIPAIVESPDPTGFTT